MLTIIVGASTMLLPLCLEVAWRHGAVGGTHVQPEVVVVEHAGGAAVKGQDPYQEVVRDGRVVVELKGRPAYERFFPYLPLMSVFGLPSTAKAPVELTDARILFSCATLALVAVALALSGASVERKLRVAQVLLVFPTAALPLATGGDDMPVLAMMLLAVVLAARRRHGYAGLAFGIAMAMKFTAWPLGALALLASRESNGKFKIWPMLLGEAVAFVPGVLWALHQGPTAFIQNVVAFPLGLAGVSSPAASALPGHILVTWFPAIHRILPLTAAFIGGCVLMIYIYRHKPNSIVQICRLSAWVMTCAICFAPATRVGYLIYPINLFTWAWLAESQSSAATKLVKTENELR
ncbi:MAG: glycosyltransferase family 87 protein [Actinomycetes bacterium]